MPRHLISGPWDLIEFNHIGPVEVASYRVCLIGADVLYVVTDCQGGYEWVLDSAGHVTYSDYGFGEPHVALMYGLAAYENFEVRLCMR